MNDHDNVTTLTAIRHRLAAEIEAIDKLIGQLEAGAAETRRELNRYQLGDQLGATKLARRLGCSRGHAIKLMTTELAHAVRVRADGSRWVPASAVDAWLANDHAAAA